MTRSPEFEALHVGDFRLTKAKPFSVGECVHKAVVDQALDFFKNRFLATEELVWEETPVSFRTFAESKDHMGFLPLSERQLQVVDFMLGQDPAKTFDNLNQLAILAFGKGSGKDSLVVLILLYIAHLCLCMRSPADFFGLAAGDSIDCVNVAPSGEKASDVFFEKVKQRIDRWHWLQTKYPVKNSGAFTSQLKPEAGGAVVTITKDGVVFPKGVRLLSRNSDNESAEGLNILVYTIDEAGAFVRGMQSNADKIYRALRTSATTRFGRRHKGFIIGFPRAADDFTMRMYNANLGNLHVCTDRGATWDILPHKFAKTKWVDFHGTMIPIEFEEDFKKDPTGMRMMLMAEPPETEHGFFEFPEKITECIDNSMPPAVVCEDYVKDSRICKRITGYSSTGISAHDYAVTIDLGAKGDAAALSMFHRELLGGKFSVIQDFVTRWKPDRHNHYVVSFENMKEFILGLNSRYHITGIWFDQWQSFGMQENLTNIGIPAFEYNLTVADWKTLKEIVYTKRMRLLPYAPQIEELKKLVDLGTRIDHPRTGCFTGDTEVMLVGRKSKTMRELVQDYTAGRPNLVHSYSEAEKCFQLQPIRKAWMTYRDAEVVRVTVTSGQHVDCTPDHRFMLSDGRYVCASKLMPGDCLMSVILNSHGGYSIHNYSQKLSRCVASVVHLPGKHEVFDLEIANNPNFALGAGMIVHNSKDVADTIAGAVKVLLSPTITTSSAESEWGDVETIETNLHTQDPWA